MNRIFIFILLWLAHSHSPLLAATANTLIERATPSIYQIRIMDTHSGSRAALGSGFLVSDGRLLATNYHVVSSAVMEPKKYRIEIDHQGQTLTAQVQQVDVIHDLALITPQQPAPLGTPLPLAPLPPSKGTTLYALGNPHDLGLTLTEGTYNGLVEHALIDQIHFSGAINSGMSGGPTLNGNGQVVGINVATAGNQIGFLVPVEFLAQLLTRPTPTENQTLLQHMAKDIGEHTTGMINQLLDKPWPPEPMGQVNIFAKTLPWINCNGDSNENKEQNTLSINRSCTSGSPLFLSDSFNSGFLEYEFFYFHAPRWPTLSIYRYMSENTGNAQPGNRVNKRHADNYRCSHSWVKTQNGMTKNISYCIRPYKKLQGLYDAFYVGVSTDRNHQVAMDHFTLSGVTQSASLRFFNRFKEQMSWQ